MLLQQLRAERTHAAADAQFVAEGGILPVKSLFDDPFKRGPELIPLPQAGGGRGWARAPLKR